MNDEIKVITRDRNRQSSTHPVILILDNLRSAYNVGNIFRLAEICKIEEIITCGYTVTPSHPKLEKTARGCEKLVSHRHFDTSLDAVTDLQANGYHIIAIETVENASPVWDIKFTFPTAFVFGNEAHGISRQTLEICDTFACLPVYGFKNSLNVSNCAAVVTYEAIRQLIK